MQGGGAHRYDDDDRPRTSSFAIEFQNLKQRMQNTAAA